MEMSDDDYNSMFDNALAEEDEAEENEPAGDVSVEADTEVNEVEEDEELSGEGEGDGDEEDSEAEDASQSVHIVEEPERNLVDSDGEDPVERCEYEVAIAVVDYNNDLEGVRHDEYYDSGEGSDEEEARRDKVSNFTPRHDGILLKGQKFFNKLAVKEAVLWHALKNKRNIRQIRYDKKKNSFSCLGKAKNGSGCQWKL